MARKAKATENISVYDIITDRIISELDKGIIPWQRPWFGVKDGAYSRKTGKPYSFLNQLLLGMEGEWASAKQWDAFKCCIKKGEEGSIVTFYKPQIIKEKDDEGNVTVKSIPILKYYYVFHISQVEIKHDKSEATEEEAEKLGWEKQWLFTGYDENKKKTYDFFWREHKQPEPLNAPMEITHEPVEEADNVMTSYITREDITFFEEAGNRAYYSPKYDEIHVPKREQFMYLEEFYSTAFHEMTHSTGAEQRLNRLEKTAHFGNEEYSKEELVAEIGAASLVNMLGMESEKSFRNSTAYVQSWIAALKNDKRFIIQACSKAQKAVEFILGIEKTEETTEE